MTLPADAIGNVRVHQQVLTAGQDVAGGVADALATRATKGPLLEYYGTDGDTVPLEAGDFATVANTIYGDTIDVTDAKFLIVYVAFVLDADGGAFTENANLAINIESSGDGIRWFPLGVINRAIAITPATTFRDDDGTPASQLSVTGGLASAAMSMNAVMQEDDVLLFPARASATVEALIKQADFRFLVEHESYVRVVAMASYDGPLDVVPPALYMAVQKATD